MRKHYDFKKMKGKKNPYSKKFKFEDLPIVKLKKGVKTSPWAPPKTLYCCGVDYQHELGETTVPFFKSIRSLKKHQKCWKQCGIVKVTMREFWLVKQKLPLSGLK